MNNEKKQFAERLAAAMVAAGYEARPMVLEAQFNSRYWGKPVTYQGARRWLIGLSIPEQDKLQVLADWLRIDPHVLRFGQRGARKVREEGPAWPTAQRADTQRLVELYLALPADEQKLVRELLEALGRRGAAKKSDRQA